MARWPKRGRISLGPCKSSPYNGWRTLCRDCGFVILWMGQRNPAPPWIVETLEIMGIIHRFQLVHDFSTIHCMVSHDSCHVWVNSWFKLILEDDHGIPDGGITISNPPRDRDAKELEHLGEKLYRTNILEILVLVWDPLYGGFHKLGGIPKAGWFISWEIPI